ncbi:alpha/beta fold hydrolase [Nocardia sp. NPDC059091]|uniref:alpha/beta fold hydrolase n=1 Tax=unclassified Nocardia TaxID=2637762 RepID=UPI00367B9039
MAKLTVGRENSDTIDIYYEDHGSGRPVVLIHGWCVVGQQTEQSPSPTDDAAWWPAGP